jgi:hypothetical protein
LIFLGLVNVALKTMSSQNDILSRYGTHGLVKAALYEHLSLQSSVNDTRRNCSEEVIVESNLHRALAKRKASSWAVMAGARST